MATDRYLMVVAIDFGTTFSGYAFSFKSDPNNIKMNKNWGENLGFQSYKTPTSLLLNSKGKRQAFGFEAEEKYSGLHDVQTTPNKHALFQRFKMALHGKKITEKLLLHSSNGCIRPALDIFAMSLEYLKEQVFEVIGQLERQPTNHEIKWVLTVPAIWGDSAKQFMRKAAKQAGLIKAVDSEQLMIALEPEAASFYCRTLDMKNFYGMDSKKGNLKFKPGSKYMIIDAGGGTIDITVHETQADGTVIELHQANGGPWGGSCVDEKYEELLVHLLGASFIQHFKECCSSQWLNMMIDFERKKRVSKPDSDNLTNLAIPMGFAKEFEKFTGKDFESVFAERRIDGVNFSSVGFLCISSSAMAKLFKPILTRTKQHLEDLLKQQAVSGVKHIFLVGGFGECSHLKKMVQHEFGGRRTILVPEEASLCVLKGAVLYGHKPAVISSRVASLSYGIAVYRDFIEGKDDEKHKSTIEGEGIYIRHVKPLVQVNENLPLNTVRSTHMYPTFPDQTIVYIRLFASHSRLHKTDTLPTDPKVMFLAKVEVHSPDTSKGTDRRIKVSINFGGTEIRFSAKDCDSGNRAETTIDYD